MFFQAFATVKFGENQIKANEQQVTNTVLDHVSNDRPAKNVDSSGCGYGVVQGGRFAAVENAQVVIDMSLLRYRMWWPNSPYNSLAMDDIVLSSPIRRHRGRRAESDSAIFLNTHKPFRSMNVPIPAFE